MTDLLEWYGGRNDSIVYNEVEKFFLPIMVSLSRQVTSVVEIMQTVEEYVGKIKSIEEFSKEEKEKAVIDGFKAFVLVDHKTKEENKAFEESGNEITLTVHKRGEMLDGYKRLYLSYLNLYDESKPAKLLCLTVKNYLPELTNECPDINEEAIDVFFEQKFGNEK